MCGVIHELHSLNILMNQGVYNGMHSEIIRTYFRLSYIANVTCLTERSDLASFKEDFEHQPTFQSAEHCGWGRRAIEQQHNMSASVSFKSKKFRNHC